MGKIKEKHFLGGREQEQLTPPVGLTGASWLQSGGSTPSAGL